MVEQAVILCGGRGERLRPLTDRVNKCLIPVGNKPFVYHLIDRLLDAGILDIVLATRYLGYQFLPLTEKYKKVRISLSSGTNTKKDVLGIEKLHDRFLLVNGDCFPLGICWEDLIKYDGLCVLVKDKVDSGCAIVLKEWVKNGLLNPFKISEMKQLLYNYPSERCLHIGSFEGLEEAKEYFK